VFAESISRQATFAVPAGSGCIRNHGRTGRSGCTAAEPYPPSRNNTLRIHSTHQKEKMK
jgi:hypothetical protein